jgi:hypothetical protein
MIQNSLVDLTIMQYGIVILSIIIDDDDAMFYDMKEEDGFVDQVLDHSMETLGIAVTND